MAAVGRHKDVFRYVFTTDLPEYLFIALYYRQLSADIKMQNYKTKTSSVSPEW